MKTISASLLAHIGGEATTLARLWLVVRTDGQTFGFTDHDQDITYGSVSYEASTGFSATAIKNTSALDIDNLDVTGMLSSTSITDADLRAGLWDNATITIMRINWADPSMGVEILHKGTLGNVKSADVAFAAEMRGLTQPIQQSVGRVYLPSCDADLGDARCAVSMAGYTVTGTVTAVTSYSAFTDSGRAEAASYFTYGLLTWLTGDNAGQTMEVKTFGSGAFVLQQSMPEAIAVGDTYSVYAGCDKTLATCRDKFNNVVNFRGYPFIPGGDRMVAGS